MKKYKEVKISYFAAHLTTIVSVTLLLLIAGVIGLLAVAARNTAREVKEMQQVSIITADSVTDADAARILAVIARQPYAIEPHLVTKQQALEDWNRQTGDDLMEVAGYNFLTPEITFRLKENYTGRAEMDKIKSSLSKRPDVEEVVMPDEDTTRGMDNFFSRAFVVLGIIALGMILISCVLINNTVLLTIYSRRFTIHTMQLVGATNGFIRRPIISANILCGLIAAAIASGILLGAIEFLHSSELPGIYTYVDRGGIWLVTGSIFILGTAVCGLSAYTATTRYLRRDYDDLFRN